MASEDTQIELAALRQIVEELKMRLDQERERTSQLTAMLDRSQQMELPGPTPRTSTERDQVASAGPAAAMAEATSSPLQPVIIQQGFRSGWVEWGFYAQSHRRGWTYQGL